MTLENLKIILKSPGGTKFGSSELRISKYGILLFADITFLAGIM